MRSWRAFTLVELLVLVAALALLVGALVAVDQRRRAEPEYTTDAGYDTSDDGCRRGVIP